MCWSHSREVRNRCCSAFCVSDLLCSVRVSALEVTSEKGSTPTLALNSGAVIPFAGYAFPLDRCTLLFRYVIASGEGASSLDCASNSSLKLNGGVRRPNASRLTEA
jgi:hypothetical protein